MSDTCVSLARQWIQGCINSEKKHGKCLPPTIPPLPNRVIYIGTTDDDLRLHVSTPGEKSYYTSLSHCWGGRTPIKTTLTRLSEYTIHIPTPLPQTFADAISVTRVLDIPYIWIDSLCIVQDSKIDWIHEAGEMATIYSNSFLNISADAATDSTTGFLGQPARTISLPHSISYSFTDANGTKTERSIYVRKKGLRAQELPFHTQVHADLRSKLSTRGWVFQERLLSPRTLHFSKHEMAWECRSTSECECSANSVRSKQTASILKGFLVEPDRFHSIWRENIVPSYTSLDLTFKSDRLLAISGLVTAIGQFRRGTYVAGLWKDSEEDLLWYVSDTEAAAKTSAENVPTWSWAAVDGKVAFIAIKDYARFRKHVSLQLRNVVENPPQYGTPAYRPSLLVTGLLVTVYISHSTVESQNQEPQINHTVVISSSPKRGYQATAVYDSVCPLDTDGPYYFLLMTTGRVGPLGLLLRKSRVDQYCFERVGVVADLSDFTLRIWRGYDSDWGMAVEIEKLEDEIREMAWKNWKNVARKQTMQIV